ncbi:MAG: hypothetical protein BYD32DRAFT_430865 [Podila humilis]|nr:MAG: hypothetical protein BYD32DRAFT_430865 [Podila humilis]
MKSLAPDEGNDTQSERSDEQTQTKQAAEHTLVINTEPAPPLTFRASHVSPLTLRSHHGKAHFLTTPDSRHGAPPESQILVSNISSHHNLPIYINKSTGRLCVLWSIVQETFKNINHLVDQNKQRVFFEVNANYILQIQLSVQYSRYGYSVVSKDRVALNPPDAAQRLLHEVENDLNEYTLLLDKFTSIPFGNRDRFLRALVTSEHHYGILIEKLLTLSDIDRSVQNEVINLRLRIADVRQKIHEIDRINRLRSPMDLSSHRLEFCQPRLFLVLPTRLDSNGDLHEAELNFRLYYLCEVAASLQAYPQFIHLSNHPGYDLLWPQEFMQRFGQYALTMLQMAKHGIQNAYVLPPLDTFGILQSFNDGAPLHQLQRFTIGPLIDQAILYIQELSQMRRQVNVWPTTLDSQQIKEYLFHSDEHDGAGELCRYISSSLRTNWLCWNHALIDTVFSDYLPSPDGSRNAQLGSITFDFQPQNNISTHYTPFQDQGLAPDVTIRIVRNTSSLELKNMVITASRSGIKVLRLQGIDYDVHSSVTRMNREDIFHRPVMSSSLPMLVLTNYGCRSEDYVYLGQTTSGEVGVLLNSRPKSMAIDWQQLRIGLNLFRESIESHGQLDIELGLNRLTEVLTHLNAVGVKGIDIFHKNRWQGRFGVTECVASGLSDMALPNEIFSVRSISPGTLRRIIHRLETPAGVAQILDLIDRHSTIQCLEILIIENGAFNKLVTDIYDHWNSTNPLRLVLFEKGQAEVRATATFTVWNKPSALKEIVCEHWTGDYVSARSWNAALLDAATQEYPTMLVGFTVDVFNITDQGLTRIQRVLHDSRSEHLHIRCLSVQPRLHYNSGRVLRSIQWSTIMSLVLSGDSIDTLLRFWADGQEYLFMGLSSVSSLRRLEMNGSREARPLSHQSCLCWHSLLYSAFSLSELSMENIQLQNPHDWGLILDAVDMASLKFSYNGCNI